MATMPKRVKFRKSQRGMIRGVAQRGNEVSFGEWGLQSLAPGWITANVIEAVPRRRRPRRAGRAPLHPHLPAQVA